MRTSRQRRERRPLAIFFERALIALAAGYRFACLAKSFIIDLIYAVLPCAVFNGWSAWGSVRSLIIARRRFEGIEVVGADISGVRPLVLGMLFWSLFLSFKQMVVGGCGSLLSKIGG